MNIIKITFILELFSIQFVKILILLYFAFFEKKISIFLIFSSVKSYMHSEILRLYRVDKPPHFDVIGLRLGGNEFRFNNTV